MPTLDLRVAAAMDNFSILPGLNATNIYEDDPLYWIGNISPGNEVNFRFAGVTIPQGSTINSATLTGYARAAWAADAADYVTLGLEQVDSAGQIVNDADESIPHSEFQTRSANVGTTVQWQDGTSAGSGSAIPSPDLAAVLQQVTDRAGWASGNAIQFFTVSEVSVNDKQLWSYWNGTAANYARLEVDYTEPVAPSVTSVTVTPATATIEPAGTQQLTADVVVVGGASQAVTWTTSNAAAATVSAGGLVTGVADGTATVTATSDFDGTKSDSSVITVSTPVVSGTVDTRVADVMDNFSILPALNSTNIYEDDPLYWIANMDPPSKVNFRFENIDIPNGAQIVSATLTGYSRSNWGQEADTYTTLGVEQVDNASRIVNNTDESIPHSEFQTRSSNLGTDDDTMLWQSGTVAASGEAVPSQNIKELVQKIVDRPGWVSGNAIQFFSTSNVTDTNDYQLWSYWNGDPAYYPRLEISYEGDSDTVAPTVSMNTIHNSGEFEGVHDASGYSASADTLTVSGSASDADSGVSAVEVRFDGGAWQSATGTTSWSVALDVGTFPTGSFLIEARSRDVAGNYSTIDSQTVWHSPKGMWVFGGAASHAMAVTPEGWRETGGGTPSGDTQIVTYIEDGTTDFINPERGWMERTHHDSSKYLNLRSGDTDVPIGYSVNWCFVGYKSKDAAWGSGVGGTTETPFRLDNYLDQDLPQSLLDELAVVFNRARTAGIKVKARFMYDWGTSDDVNDRAIDATAYWVMRHMADLATVVNAHRDIILSVEGFWGAWGEQHRSGYLGTSSPYNGSYGDWGGPAFRAAYVDVADHALSVFHEDIPFAWRYPWDWGGMRLFLDGSDASHPDAETFNFAANRGAKNPADRTAHFNDCIWTDTSMGGTYEDAGDVTAASNVTSTNFMSGETCGSPGSASQESYVMDKNNPRSAWGLHMDSLYRKYSTAVYDCWKSDSECGNFIDEFSRLMGYRLVLDSATLPVEVSPGGAFDLGLAIRNVGFGKVYKPRPMNLVFVGPGGPFTTRVSSDTRPVMPLSLESKTLSWTGLTAPTGLQSGEAYSLYLTLPDPDPLGNGLAADVRYSIRLANTGVWDGTTGRHDLGATITAV